MFVSPWHLDLRSGACKRSTKGGVTALMVINIGVSLYRLDFIAERSEPGLYVDRAPSKERAQRHSVESRRPLQSRLWRRSPGDHLAAIAAKACQRICR